LTRDRSCAYDLPMRILMLFTSLLLFTGSLIQAEYKDVPIRSKWTLENAEARTYITVAPKDVEQRRVKVYVIPITDQIGTPQLYILRRGLKDAIDNGIDVVVLDMDTPGGDAETMLEMMEALDNFKGDTITFVNKEAMSAGALIAAASKSIYMHPKGVIGAAEVVMSTGQDINESMKRKINSYMDAKVRAYTKEFRYRSDIIRAMMKSDYELKIDGEVIKSENELLSLTSDEAVREFGDPPRHLLADGIVEDVNALLKDRYGDSPHTITRFELTWSEELAKWLNAIAPLLMGLGMLLLFVEFKTPGFGVFGVLGILVLIIVFFGSYTAGLAGYEALLVFVLGVVLLGVELFVLPGILVAGLLGVVFILVSLLWSMADIWPSDGNWEFNLAVLESPVLKLLLAIFIAVGGAIVLSRVIPQSWFWDKLVLSSSVSGRRSHRRRHRSSIAGQAAADIDLPSIGSVGVTVTNMYPMGEVDINGRRYMARVNVNMLEPNVSVVVVGHKAFQLVVEPNEEN